MKTNRLILMASLLCLPLMAEEKTLSDGLRDALYLEDVKRDPSAAASAYESLLDGYAQQKQFAATALFRLAEIRRTQGRKEEAIALYQRLIKEFPQAEAEIKIARENLTALGGNLPETPIVMDKEQIELQRLKRLLVDSPDVIAKIDLGNYVKENQQKIVEWLFKDAQVVVEGKGLLREAAVRGHKSMIELLVRLEPEIFKKEFPAAMEAACEYRNTEVVKSLLKLGADPNVGYEAARMYKETVADGKPLVVALARGHGEIVDLLLKSGADPSSIDGAEGITPLLAAILSRDTVLVNKMLSAGANVNAIYTEKVDDAYSSNAPITYQRNLLSIAVQYGLVDICKILIENKIKVNDPNLFRFLLRGQSNFGSNELNDQNYQCIKLLLDAGYDPNLKIDNRVHLVAYFYHQDNLEMAKKLIDKGAKIEDLEPYVDNSNWRATTSFSGARLRTIHEPVKKHGKLNLTQKAAVQARPEFLALFLSAGGKLDTKEQSSEYFLSQDWMSSTNAIDSLELACVKIFVEQGLKPEESWRNSGYPYAPAEIKKFLNERFPSEKAKTAEKPKKDPSR